MMLSLVLAYYNLPFVRFSVAFDLSLS